MKIVLCFPRFKYPSGDIPIGIATLAGYIREKTEHKVKILDTTFNPSFDYVREYLEKEFPHYLGIHAMTLMHNDVLKICEIAKETRYTCKTIIGGAHATVMGFELIKNKYVDFVCEGEGEENILKIMNNEPPKNIFGLWHKRRGSISYTGKNSAYIDLDSLPRPAYDLLDMENYIKHWFQMDAVSTKLRGINVITSRGCPYNCSFCQPTLRKMFGNKIRRRSPENVVKELKYLKNRYKINATFFQDDTFNFSKKYVKNICNIMIKGKLNLIWGCNSRADTISEDSIKIMKKAGLKLLNIGIESGSQRILDDIYNKGIALNDVKNAISICRKYKIHIHGYFILGAPTETEEEIKETINFASSLPIDEATFSLCTPLPGTYLYEKCKAHSKNFSEYNYYNNNAGISEIPLEKLRKLKRKAFIKFYIHPKRFPYLKKSFSSYTAIKKSLLKLKRLSA